jgi:hypothetical protein
MHSTLLREKSTNNLLLASLRTAVCWLFVLFLTSISYDALASTFYVKTNGTGSGTGSWTNASNNVQAMINAANAGDEIWVATGTYQPAAGTSFYMKEGVKIYGGFSGYEVSLEERNRTLGFYRTTLTGGGAVDFTIDNTDISLTNAAVLDGFDITGGINGGIINSTNPKLANLYVTGNGNTDNSSNGAIYNIRCSPMLLNVKIISNTGLSGLWNENSSPVLVNCTIANNTITRGHVVNRSSSPALINCTVAGEITIGTQSYGVTNLDSSSPKIYNSIINGAADAILNRSGSDIQNSMVYARTVAGPEGYPIPSGIDARFENPDLGNYRLTLCSPAVNAGSNGFYDSGRTPDISGITTDSDRYPRFYGTVDQGAYELQSDVQAGVAGVWYVKPGGTGTGNSWDCPLGDLQLAINSASSGQQVWVGAGTYQPGNTLYKMKEGVQIYGGFAGNETSLAQRNLSINANKSILDGNDGPGIINNNIPLSNAAVLDGFTITGSNGAPTIVNGSASSPKLVNLAVIDNQYTGIFLLGSSSVLINCIFNNNSTGSVGGAVLISGGSPTFINCSLTNNLAGSGGGMFISNATPTLVNCQINNNRANYGAGISIENSAAPIITNCTIADNTATIAGGGILNRYGSTASKLRNSIVFGNSSGIVNEDISELEIQYSLVQKDPIPGGPATANIDPLFVNAAEGNYRLQPCSPAVNAGFNYFQEGQTPDLSTVTTDLGNMPRLREHIVDMGAYEYSGATRGLATDQDEASANITRDYVLTSDSDCRLVAYLNPSGVVNGLNAVSGPVSAKVWVAGTQPKDFVKRHYQITPANNAAGASSRVTLFFTQQEFDDFNAVNEIKLPLNAADTENYKANLRIEKRPGVSGDGSGLPNSYTGVVSTFKPSEVNGKVEWNADGQYWEVTFDVMGFSGFFVKTNEAALPLNLISFTATKEAGSNLLQWSTTSEVNTDNFEIQSSGDAKKFIPLATINAAGSGDHKYSYLDQNQYKGSVYYRLKMSDRAANRLDETYTYSKIISLKNGSELTGIYPNPARETVTFEVNNALLKSTANLYDILGRKLQSIVITTNKQEINIKSLASGLYIMKFADGTAERFVKE